MKKARHKGGPDDVLFIAVQLTAVQLTAVWLAAGRCCYL